ncbi:hypothetical protein [Kribbella rubisoli]|uniref:hypothetical protein n=1 Tax=Kribbella rubisoli TaxID=3075929 RepID=UPI0018E53B82|nr:hypothetical protein [Kribbella rubisoli]
MSSARPVRWLISAEPIAAGASPRMIRPPSTRTLLDPATVRETATGWDPATGREAPARSEAAG